MSDSKTLAKSFVPFARAVASLDLSAPEAAQRALNEQFPLDSLADLEAAAKAAQSEGWLTPRQATPTLRFGRLSKPTDDMLDHSIDVVDMVGAGAEHTHPNGEVSLCFVQEGEPRFCGHPPGWVVLPPGSHHTPEVTGGRMLIFYLLPGGAMKWGSPDAG